MVAVQGTLLALWGETDGEQPPRAEEATNTPRTSWAKPKRRRRRRQDPKGQSFFGFAFDLRQRFEEPPVKRKKARGKPKRQRTLKDRLRTPPANPVREYRFPDNHIAGMRVDLTWSLNQARARWLGGVLSDHGYWYYRERWMKHNGWGTDEDLPNDTKGDVDVQGVTRFKGIVDEDDL